jgi:DNA-binding PadR family transcriptional regulator
MTDLVLLAALLRGPAYGYDLKRTAGLIFGGKSMHSNVVYPTLKRFAQNGWVVQRTTPGQRGQTRKQYSITTGGRTYLLAQLQAFGEQEAAGVGPFLLRVALFDALPKPARKAIVAARASFLKQRSEQLSQLRQETRPRSFAAVALDRVRDEVANERRWIRKLEQLTESRERG